MFVPSNVVLHSLQREKKNNQKSVVDESASHVTFFLSGVIVRARCARYIYVMFMHNFKLHIMEQRIGFAQQIQVKAKLVEYK